MDERKAYLLGFMAGDGNVSVSTDGGAQVSANCGQVSDPANRVLADLIAGLLAEIYDVPAKVREERRVNQEGREPYWQPIVYRRAVAEDLLSYGGIGTYDWEVPRAVARKARLFRAWLSGFSDAEGCVRNDCERGSRYVSLSSVNRAGLEQVRRLLEDLLKIRCSWSTNDKRAGTLPEHKLLVCNRRSLERFAEQVGFRHPGKAARLAEALASYQRGSPNLLRDETAALFPQILRRRAANVPFDQIVAEFNLASAQVAKGMIKRASKKAGSRCMLCLEAPATHSVPRVVRGRSARYVCESCLGELEPQEEWTDELVQLKTSEVADFLDAHHYLGRRGGRNAFAFRNRSGVLVFSYAPQAFNFPRDWLELSRWCVVSEEEGAATKQWRRVRRWLMEHTEATTVVSYSDPSRHDGALYRAAGWLWAPSGQYLLKSLALAKERHPDRPYRDKERWIYPLRPDPRRAEVLTIRHPWLYQSEETRFLCDWNEPRWKRGRATGGGKDRRRFLCLLEERAERD